MKFIFVKILMCIIILSIVIVNGQGVSKKTSPVFREGKMIPTGVVTGWEAEISIPVLPRVGEPFEVTFEFRCNSNAWEQSCFGPDYTFAFTSKHTTILSGEKTEFHGFMRNGDEKFFQATMVIKEPVEQLIISGGVRAPGWPSQQIGIDIYLIDEEKGQYGTREQWEAKEYGVLARFNNLEPRWLDEFDPFWIDTNRKIVSQMRLFEPTLTDSEALCLHVDNYLLIVNGIGNPGSSDQERIERLLDAGWLEAQRTGETEKTKWFNDFMDKNRGAWEGGDSSPNFFLDSDDSYSSDRNNTIPEIDRVATTFIGTWKYQDHNYDTTGLKTTYTVKTRGSGICS